MNAPMDPETTASADGDFAATADFLGSTSIFGDFDGASLERLAHTVEPVQVPGGTTLMTEGEVGDSLFVVRHGRLRVFVHQDGAGEVAVNEIGVGELVGEMALLSDQHRSATVRAVRDTALLRLSRAAFEELVDLHPEMLLELTRLLVTRLHSSIRATRLEGSLTTLAVVPADPTIDASGFAAGLVEALGAWGRAALVDPRAVDDHFGPGYAEARLGTREDIHIAAWLHRLEASHDVVVFKADTDPSPWTRRCLRQADHVLVVVPGTPAAPSPVETKLLHDPKLEIRPTVDLVFVHDPEIARPFGTGAALGVRAPDGHHHIRRDSVADLERLARILARRSVALVLGGGGARGWAHVGVLKALIEHDIPIDFIGGTSMGALVAAGFAMGMSYEELVANLKGGTVDRGSLIDFTVPAAALAKGAKLTEAIRDNFGDVHVEDLWYPFFCVSTDLTDGALRVHAEGPVWKALRASVAIPGTFPPMLSSDGHVLVDGGVMDNLPVDVMRRFAEGATVLAVDLRAKSHFPSKQLPDDGVLSGWGVAGRRLNPFIASLDVPRMIDVLLRSTEVASGAQRYEADLTFLPPVEEFAILDFKSHRKILDAGYQHALTVLKEWTTAEGAELLPVR